MKLKCGCEIIDVGFFAMPLRSKHCLKHKKIGAKISKLMLDGCPKCGKNNSNTSFDLNGGRCDKCGLKLNYGK